MRSDSGRLREVQSRINCVRILSGGCCRRISDIGCTLLTVFMSSGNSLLLTSAVALQEVKTWSMESVWCRHRSQAAERFGLSMEILSFVK